MRPNPKGNKKCEQQVTVILYRASDRSCRLHIGKTYALAVALAIFVFVGSTANSLGSASDICGTSASQS